MIQTKIFILLVVLYYLPSTLISAPVQEGTRDLNNPYDSEPEDRRHRRRKQRPCRRDAEGDGRTFFDWNYSYVNVNHNYNVNCGGGGSGGNRPQGGQHHQGGGLFGSHGGGGGHLGGGGSGIHNGGGGIHNLGGGGGGIHNLGGGILNGGSGIHNNGGGGGIHNGGGGNNNANGGSHGNGGGLFGLGLFNNLFGGNHRPSTPRPESITPPPLIQADPPEPEKPPETEKPDYDYDKPVHEDYDVVLPEGYQNWKPGQYVTAYNPIYGSYVQDVSNFNPNRIVKQVNREINKFFRPLYHLFRR